MAYSLVGDVRDYTTSTPVSSPSGIPRWLAKGLTMSRAPLWRAIVGWPICACLVAVAKQPDHGFPKMRSTRHLPPGRLRHGRAPHFAELEIIPQRAYYGTQTTPAMFVLALSEYWH